MPLPCSQQNIITTMCDKPSNYKSTVRLYEDKVFGMALMTKIKSDFFLIISISYPVNICFIST